MSSAHLNETYEALNGQRFEIEYTNIRPTMFCLSIHKAGSVLMFQIVSEIMRTARLPACDFYGQIWAAGISIHDLPPAALSAFNHKGVLYYGVRDLNQVRWVSSFWPARKLALIRDPRDIVVSFYFSGMKSHSLPPSGRDRKSMFEKRTNLSHLSVSEYILEGHADWPLRNLESYISLLDSKANCHFYKYEDIIFEKRAWVASLAAELDVDLSPDVLAGIADRHDAQPADSDPDRHIRQVRPGDYKNHLNNEAVDYIQSRFASIFKAFGYAPA